MEQEAPKQKKSVRKWIFVLAGAVVVMYGIFFIVQVLKYRGQILSGKFDFNQYASNVSGRAGGPITFQEHYDVTSPDDPRIGSPQPKVMIVEFGDFECPYCRSAYPIIRSLVAKYEDDIALQYRDFPLQEIHPNAFTAAKAGYCADKQGKFWPLHDRLFQNQQMLDAEHILAYADQVGIDRAAFISCINSDRAQKEVEEDVFDGVSAGVSGTPTWFINGIRVSGVIPQEAFEQIIQSMINQ